MLGTTGVSPAQIGVLGIGRQRVASDGFAAANFQP